MTIQALEIQDDEPEGYEFSVCDDAEDDLFALFAKLVERMRRDLHEGTLNPAI